MGRLPAELLSLVFDLLCLSELLVASHVATFWRAVAIRHPTFWRFISIKTLSPAEVDCFLSRIAASALLDVELTVNLPHIQSRSQLRRSAILPAITRNLSRISQLHLEFDIRFDSDVFATLRKPAPRLVTLNLCMAHDTRSSDLLPVDLFDDCAPRLQRVMLQHIWPAYGIIPTALRSIVELRYLFQGHQTFRTAFFSHCPRLEHLCLGVGSLIIDPHEVQRRVPREWVKNLHSLEVSLRAGWKELVRCMPCEHIASVSVPVDLEDELPAAQLLTHLRGPLDLVLLRKDHIFCLQYRAPASKMMRTFMCHVFGSEMCALPQVYVADDLISRVETALSNKSLNSFRAFGSLPACTAFSLLIMEGESLSPPTAALSVPQLRQVDIRSERELTLPAGELRKFINAAFAVGTPRPMRVLLQGITLEGDLGVINAGNLALAVDQ